MYILNITSQRTNLSCMESADFNISADFSWRANASKLHPTLSVATDSPPGRLVQRRSRFADKPQKLTSRSARPGTRSHHAGRLSAGTAAGLGVRRVPEPLKACGGPAAVSNVLFVPVIDHAFVQINRLK